VVDNWASGLARRLVSSGVKRASPGEKMKRHLALLQGDSRRRASRTRLATNIALHLTGAGLAPACGHDAPPQHCGLGLSASK